MTQNQTTPLVKSEAAKSIAVLAFGQSRNNTEALRAQHLVDEFHIEERRARLVAALAFGVTK